MTVALKALASAALSVVMQGEALIGELGTFAAQAGTETVVEYIATQGVASTATLSNGATVLYEAFGTGFTGATATSGISATEAIGAFAAGGGDIAVTGAATQAATQGVAEAVVMEQAGVSGASIGGLLSMSLPAAAAAVAPLLGVGLGYELYKSNPDFWDKVSRTLLPFCYEDTDVLPAYVDKYGNTFIGKDCVNAIKELFEEEGIGPEAVSKATVDYDGNSYQTGIGKYRFTIPTVIVEHDFNGGPGAFYYNGSSMRYISNTQFPHPLRYYDKTTGEIIYEETSNLNYNGDFYYLSETLGEPYSPSLPFYPDIDSAILEGTITPDVVYPEGTSNWDGNTVDIPSLPISKVFTDGNGGYTEVIPVSLPTDPKQSNDPAVNPDPTVTVNPGPVITQYISPSTIIQQSPDYKPVIGEKEAEKQAPINWPIPGPQITPSPTSNPSQPPASPGKSFLPDIIPFIPLSSGFSPTEGVPLPDAPFSDVAGLITVYHPTASELIAFSRWLWVTYADATIDKIWNNPFDGIISLHELYSTPTDSASKINIRSGFLVSNVQSYAVPVRYTEINCGSVVVPEYYRNYLDYSPYSKAHIYLPFIGIVELNVDDIVGHGVNVTYRVDAYSGACIALITVAKEDYSNTVYQYSGNCSVEVPIAGGSQASIKAGQMMASAQQHAAQVAGVSGLLSGLGSLLNLNIGGVLGGIGNAMSSIAYGQANALQSTLAAKSSVQHSGTFGESFGAMGHKKPYLIIRRPIQVSVPNYNEEYGFPAHRLVRVSDCEGFIRVREVHVTSSTATDEEKARIEEILKGGAFV